MSALIARDVTPVPRTLKAPRTVEPRPIHAAAPAQTALTDRFLVREPFPIPSSLDVRDLAWIDVDLDGDIDLALGIDGRSLLLRQDEGRFVIDDGWNPMAARTESLAWADVDGDGWWDLVEGNHGAPNRLYRNHEGILDSTPSWSSVGDDPTYALVWADVDGDGDPDLAVGNGTDPDGGAGSNEVFLNQNGDLAPEPGWRSDDDSDTRALAWGDADGDGDFDLVAGNFGQPNRMYVNRSTEAGQVGLERGASWETVTADDTVSLVFAEIDNQADAGKDLLVGNRGQSDRMYPYTASHGLRNFTLAVRWESAERASTSDIIAADVTGNGHVDILSAGGGLRLYAGRNGNFDRNPEFEVGSGLASSAITAADFDADGDIDIVEMGSGQPARLYENQLISLEEEPFWHSAEFEPVEHAAWADVDGDGDLDLLRNGVNGLGLYLNDGGRLATRAIWEPAREYSRNGPTAWGDLDGDGRPDLAVGDRNKVTVVHLNTGDPARGYLEAEPSHVMDAEGDTSRLAWGDLDGDGDLDLAESICGCKTTTSERTRVYENRGGQLVTPPVWIVPSASTGAQDLAWGDIDKDGDLELAISYTGAPGTRIYENRDGELSDELLQDVDGSLYHQIALRDIDGDANLDLVGLMASRIELRYGDGQRIASQQLADQHLDPEGSSTLTSMDLGDLDGDGRLDIVAGQADRQSGDEQGRTLAWIQDADGFRAGHDFNAVHDWASRDVFQNNLVRLVDIDTDGDLDLFAGNEDAPSGFYENRGPGNPPNQILDMDLTFDPPQPEARSLAWGDVNADGFPDLAAGFEAISAQTWTVAVFRNTQMGGGDRRYSQLVLGPSEADVPASANDLAWGDFDGDGDIDLAVAMGSRVDEEPTIAAAARIHCTESGNVQDVPCWRSDDAIDAQAIAPADVDGDGDLDLAIAHRDGRIELFRNTGDAQILESEPSWSIRTDRAIHAIAWGDVDADGDLDLALAREGKNWVLVNDRGQVSDRPAWQSDEAQASFDIAWGDVDADGGLDLVSANVGQNHIHFNAAGMPAALAGWRSDEIEESRSVALVDLDGAGWLDLVVGNRTEANSDDGAIRAYAGGTHGVAPRAVWAFSAADVIHDIAWGDDNRDGRPDLAAASGAAPGRNHQGVLTFRNMQAAETRFDKRPDSDWFRGNGLRIDNHRSAPASTHAGHRTRALALSGGHATALIREGIVPVTYSLRTDLLSAQDPILTEASYSVDGGGHWHKAIAASDSTLPPGAGDAAVYRWDIVASGFFGRSDDSILRLAIRTGDWLTRHGLPGLMLFPRRTAQSLPFRVRGQQIQVLDAEGVPVEGAMVYRLPAGDLAGGQPMADQAGRPFLTDADGFLQGRGEVHEGDRLLALAPAALPENLRSGLGDRLRLYHTNGRVTERGVEAQLVSLEGNEQGIHRLTVSPEQPLMLFDMDISLEWDASATPRLDKLSADIRSASAHLYDFTNGQVALGDVRLFQNGDEWAFAHTVIRASNRLRPFAVQGGAILEPLADPDHPEIDYAPGQVVMGAEWNRYGGGRDDSSADDWALMLAHELGHYLLFLDDTYLGLDERERLIPVTSCTGSAMGDMYGSDENREFVPDGAHWDSACGQTLTARTLGRSEWGTITRWFPFLNPPEHHAENPGPRRMPYALTEVRVQPPITGTASSAVEPIFFLDYAAGESPSSDARAYRLARRDGTFADDAGEWEFVIDLGSPTEGDDHALTARGIQPGDRLCLFDPTRRQQGCEIVRDGDERIALQHLPDWRPELTLRPVNTTTLSVRLEGGGELSAGDELRVQVFPELGPASEALRLEPDGDAWTGVVELAHASFSGHVRTWVQDGAGQDSDPREIIVGWQVAGNPGPIRGGGPAWRGAGGIQRGGGPAWRGAGGGLRGGGAPVASADGRMIVYTPNPLDLEVGTLFAVQELAALPPLPSDKTAIGQGYSIVGSDAAPADIPGSVSFQYRGVDADRERADRKALKIHHWSDGRWQVLPTTTEPRYNFASATSAGQGGYALLDGITQPRVNDFVPGTVESGTAITLTLIGGDFLEPLEVELVDRGAPKTLPARRVDGGRISLSLPADLPPGAYRVSVINGDSGRTTAARRLSVLEPVDACFHDFFESGASQWTLDEPWDIVQLADGQRALSDSPSGPYLGATGSETRRIQATSRAFTLDSSRCPSPVLSLRHAHALARGDRARVELLASNDTVLQVVLPDVTGYSEDHPLIGEGLDLHCSPHCGSAWSRLVDRLTRPLMLPNERSIPLQGAPTDEWRSDELRDVGPLPIDPRGEALRLRLVLEVDDRGSDRGWLVDDIAVHAAETTAPRPRPLRLPYELWLPRVGGGG